MSAFIAQTSNFLALINFMALTSIIMAKMSKFEAHASILKAQTGIVTVQMRVGI